ncbi:hypothetical protein [Planomicrobium sp. YIM 101495]|uniref:hypothetical protein n=1 Tax=Planomicrobium sp. YIM 101495 TaxID=2665160 RepID=UPI0012B7BA99|nr:hypothetical protein [Planomicrobium sp. YIM 101495]MTD30753.1 hypothetical protein [Planomicrobium sp. YIM 101495]
MKEIGGYFGMETFDGKEYHGDLIRLNTGRNALHYLMQAKRIRKLYIPAYICDVVLDMLVKYGHAFEYYGVHADFTPRFEGTLGEGEFLYVVNYYGQLSDQDVVALKARYGRVILDNTHAFFQQSLAGIDTIYSCRKFFGVPDGAYLATDTELGEPLQQDKSGARMGYLLGRFEEGASAYYGNYVETGNALADEPLKRMSKLTQNLLQAVDYAEVCRRRNENYVYLAGELGGANGLQPVVPDGPFAYPFYAENGVALRKLLAAQGIYVPTLWPNVLEDAAGGSLEFRYAANILPLPCDQRYGVEEMRRMVGVLLALIAR